MCSLHHQYMLQEYKRIYMLCMINFIINSVILIFIKLLLTYYIMVSKYFMLKECDLLKEPI